MTRSALTLAEMGVNLDIIDVLRGTLHTMNFLEDSSFYQLMLKEGREVGLRKGEIKGARELLIRVGRIRFGRLPKAIRAAIEAIDDLDRLSHAICDEQQHVGTRGVVSRL